MQIRRYKYKCTKFSENGSFAFVNTTYCTSVCTTYMSNRILIMLLADYRNVHTIYSFLSFQAGFLSCLNGPSQPIYNYLFMPLEPWSIWTGMRGQPVTLVGSTSSIQPTGQGQYLQDGVVKVSIGRLGFILQRHSHPYDSLYMYIYLFPYRRIFCTQFSVMN